MKVIKKAGVTLVKEDDGSIRIQNIIEPLDPRENPGVVAKAVEVIIAVILWMIGEVRSRRVRDRLARAAVQDWIKTEDAAA